MNAPDWHDPIDENAELQAHIAELEPKPGWPIGLGRITDSRRRG